MSFECPYYPHCGCAHMGMHCMKPTMEEAIADSLGLDAVPTEEEEEEAIKQALIHKQTQSEIGKAKRENLVPIRAKKSKYGRNYTPPKKRHRK